MPTYQYTCTACGADLEAVQKFTDDSLETCPQCEGKLRKVFSAVGVVFKGSGFYRNDSRSGSSSSTAGNPANSTAGNSANGSAGAEGSAEKKSEGGAKESDSATSSSQSSGSSTGSASDSGNSAKAPAAATT